ncbi:Protein of unknown function DUF91 [Chryseobacterium wanjuense]|uniref:Endonuclease NucS C-terminal domain-containing protein n=1 Tax=Chryseobacterium wanjuense TaxID=356305 RepID=A0A1I0P1A3_9FLAO|nr:endonuclease NucS domain-containing protein [Chryseobacterium wanjuense]SEW07821.1 Protein of unknown function DUF91 [Chryseobacterium wanjuense]
MTENQIRDLLVQNLSLINPYYIFLDKEAYLPNNIGTRSFIDILAINNENKYVIIEVKKSNASSREAIHELYKYLEAVKQNLAVKSDEIELVIVSTEWKELLVPYSSFINSTDLKSYGYQLFINEEGISVKKIDTNATQEDRILSAIQMARYYLDEASLQEGIREHINFFQNRDINNFILIILKSPENYSDLVLKSIQNFEISMYNEIRTENLDPNLNFEYMIYSINQTLSLNSSTEILLKHYSSPEIIEEIEEIKNLEETFYTKMEMLNQMIINQMPFPKCDYVEIGTPAKYVKFIEDEKWQLIEIKKYGALLDNIFLTNDIIEQEIIASGTTKERYTSTLDLMNTANLARVKKEIKNVLSDNIVWRNHILEILEQLTYEKEHIKYAHISIYNPMNIIYSIYLLFNQQMGLRYIPSYQIEVLLNNNEERLYVGHLDGNLRQTTMDNILQKFWNSEAIEYLLTLNWGGYFNRNLELCEFIGLEYKTMLIKAYQESTTHFKYRNYKFIEVDNFDPLENIINKLSNDLHLVPNIFSFFNEHKVKNGYWEFNR